MLGIAVVRKVAEGHDTGTKDKETGKGKEKDRKRERENLRCT